MRCATHSLCGRRAAWLALVVMLAQLATLQAAPHRPRFGFQHFGARYTGGYSIVTPEGTSAGPADIRIRVPRDGRSARVTWSNIFYTSHGSYRIALRWTFLPDGTVVANTIDPRFSQPAATGSFTLDRNHPVLFTATSEVGSVSGQLRLIGGGALSITATLSGLPEGDVSYSFSGGRKR